MASSEGGGIASERRSCKCGFISNPNPIPLHPIHLSHLSLPCKSLHCATHRRWACRGAEIIPAICKGGHDAGASDSVPFAVISADAVTVSHSHGRQKHTESIPRDWRPLEWFNFWDACLGSPSIALLRRSLPQQEHATKYSKGVPQYSVTMME
ncbi:hypothetical protein N658DRAFT_109868 [Parathielavia hyrcaniae]|uniref:Uncharacterized protein n=1 Tax=Parathielavia hyrcaniae TaxID=113614 RepID=A0AAN6Q7Q8_9PEZI|nr:hypothetical protein N658DRAFT_109868 [Parathielavia hyrcaniae]